jgi:hypothetical protein
LLEEFERVFGKNWKRSENLNQPNWMNLHNCSAFYQNTKTIYDTAESFGCLIL